MTSSPRGIRVLVAAHQASERRGGAAALPIRLFGRLRASGTEAWLVTHDSERTELRATWPAAEFSRVFFVPSLPGLHPVFTRGERLPPGLRSVAWGITQLERQAAMAPAVRRLVRDLSIDVVHQPISVSPVMPSPLARVGAPVVMGPLNGGMILPPAFRDRDSALVTLIQRARSPLALAANTIVRGRLEADVLLVANERTRALLPGPARRRAVRASDIGVVLDSWPALTAPRPAGDAGITRFLFTGRLVGWKGVDLLLDSFARLAGEVPAHLDIVGDGPERARLTEQAGRLGCTGNVTFHGWLDPAGCARRMQACDVFVSAALQESGGIAVLEAMSSGRPVIATAWGGHLDTLDDATGILVGVSSRETLVAGMAAAMARLATAAELRARLGAAGRRRVEERYDWDVLTARLLRTYGELRARARPAAA
jgi:glycosyltransferase involved in cell wall biosynthesis